MNKGYGKNLSSYETPRQIEARRRAEEEASKGFKDKEARGYGERLYGQTQEQTGQDVQDIVQRRREILDQKDPASTWIQQSTNRRLRQARAQAGPQRLTEQQERQVSRQGEADIGKAMYTTQRQNLTDYQRLIGDIAAGQASTEFGMRGTQIAAQPIEMPEKDSGMCFITTAICNYLGFADNCYILNTFRKFRDDFMKVDDDMKRDVKKYYDIAPAIVEQIKGRPEILDKLIVDYLLPCLKLIEGEENLNAYKKYKGMVEYLQEICNAENHSKKA